MRNTILLSCILLFYFTLGKTAVLNSSLFLEDTVPPKISCFNYALTQNIKSTGFAQVNAKDLILTAVDDETAAEQLRFYFDGNPKVSSKLFGCNTLARESTSTLIELKITVEDLSGNQAHCISPLLITDPLEICPSDPGLSNYSLKIEIMPYKTNSIFDANISVVGPNFSQSFSGQSVQIEFLDPGKYEVCIEKNDDPINGVSTADIYKIRRHILGIEEFTDLYQYIAADVNNSCSITASDMSEIKKLLFGTIDKFRHKDSWQFVPVNFSPPNPTDCTFSKCWDIEIKDRNVQLEFAAIKIGDVR